MRNKGWLIPILIVVANAIAIIVVWRYLPEELPAHFDLQGNASGLMSRSVLPLYPRASAVLCLAAYLISKKINKLLTGIIILISGISLVMFFSTMVTLTSGEYPAFMLAEPVILLIAVVAFVVCVIKSRKKA